MAGDWIKVEKATARKPEVLRIADLLGIPLDHAFGLCVRFWSWVDDHVATGHVHSVTCVTLETVFGHAGFVDALLSVGWLRVRNSSLVIPNFDRHLSESAKNRALSRERKQKQRSQTVTEMSRSERTREEKRREEVNTKRTGKFLPPSVEEVRAYCSERGNGIDPAEFVDHYTANGWVQGNRGKPLVDWRAAVRTWEKNRKQRGSQPQQKQLTDLYEDLTPG